MAFGEGDTGAIEMLAWGMVLILGNLARLH